MQHEKEKRPKRRRKLLHDTSDISSVGFQAHGTLDEYRFNMFMRDLLTEKAKDIYRCKGVLAVHVSNRDGGVGFFTSYHVGGMKAGSGVGSARFRLQKQEASSQNDWLLA
eukprot:1149421-Pelagomonas_calceolata.AAC.4